MTRLIVDDGGARRAFKLNDGRLTVGCGEGATLRLTAEGVAEAHADLVIAEGRVRLAPRPGVLPPLVAGVPARGEIELKHDAAVKIGGATLTVESNLIPGKGNLKLTGSLGDVMAESANIALSWVRSVGADMGVDDTLYENNFVHLHVPAGATPKDGPSAGITMASAMLSLVTGRKIKSRLAMTGEISLIGNVLPVGGIKEKVIAAKRAKMREIILPKENQKDLNEIPELIKKGITFHLVEKMDDVLQYVFTK